MSSTTKAETRPVVGPEGVVFAVLLAISFSHFLNDTMQSLLPAIYPTLKTKFSLNFGQIGLLTFVFQVTASLLQPIVGLVTDKRPQPYSLAAGMGFTMVGLIMLSHAGSFPMLLVAAAMIGIGSSIFHPESSRVARLSSGGRHGFAQSVFQVGGNFGTAIGPVLAAFIVVPDGQGSILWFSAIALVGMVVLSIVGRWYQKRMAMHRKRPPAAVHPAEPFRRGKVAVTMAILIALVFSKFFYLASISSYYTFYFDSSLWDVRATCSAHAVRLFGCCGVGHRAGWPDRGSDRSQARDLGVYPRGPAVHLWRFLSSASEERLFFPSSLGLCSPLRCPR